MAAMIKTVLPDDLGLETATIPLVASYRTTLSTTKAWITPQNTYVPLRCWHWEFFGDREIAMRYGVLFEAEGPTRLAALRVGFIRVNYEINGGRLTIEAMRWEPSARMAVGKLIEANRDSVDNLVVRILSSAGDTIKSVFRSFLATDETTTAPLNKLLKELVTKETQ